MLSFSLLSRKSVNKTACEVSEHAKLRASVKLQAPCQGLSRHYTARIIVEYRLTIISTTRMRRILIKLQHCYLLSNSLIYALQTALMREALKQSITLAISKILQAQIPKRLLLSLATILINLQLQTLLKIFIIRIQQAAIQKTVKRRYSQRIYLL